MIPCLYQSNVYSKTKLWLWRVQKCIPLVGVEISVTCAGLQTTPSQVSQYRAENGNLLNPESTFSLGSMIAPKQCSYQKEATGMESRKMCSFCRSKNLTYLCGTANDHVSSKQVQRREQKFAEFLVYF